MSPPLTEEEQRILDWLEAEELILGGLFTPAWNDRAGDYFVLR